MTDFNDFLYSEDISDELLAAYIDGNTTAEESAQIEDTISHDDLLSEVIDVVQDGISSEGCLWDMHQGDFGYWELGLPPVFEASDLLSGNSNWGMDADYENILSQSDMFSLGKDSMDIADSMTSVDLDSFDQ